MPAVRGGQFRHQGDLQSRSAIKGAMGGQSADWTTYAAGVFASITPLNGNERSAAQAVAQSLTHQITIYWTPAYTVSPGHRFVVGSRVFDIRAAWNDQEANRIVVMQATELATQG